MRFIRKVKSEPQSAQSTMREQMKVDDSFRDLALPLILPFRVVEKENCTWIRNLRVPKGKRVNNFGSI